MKSYLMVYHGQTLQQMLKVNQTTVSAAKKSVKTHLLLLTKSLRENVPARSRKKLTFKLAFPVLGLSAIRKWYCLLEFGRGGEAITLHVIEKGHIPNTAPRVGIPLKKVLAQVVALDPKQADKLAEFLSECKHGHHTDITAVDL